MAQKKKGGKHHAAPKNIRFSQLPEYRYFKEHFLFALLADLQQDPATGAFTALLQQELITQTELRPLPDRDEFARKMVPLMAISERAMDYRAFSADTLGKNATPSTAFFVLGALYYDLISREGKLLETGELTEKELRAIKRRYKLITHITRDSNRTESLFATLSIPPEFSKDELSDFDRNPTPHGIMQRLIVALQNDEKEEANRLIGLLQTKRNELSPGEYEYFSAMVYAKDNSARSLDRALKELEKIPADSPDFKKSRGLFAEILARKGNIGEFCRVFDYAESIRYAEMFCYFQDLLFHIDIPAGTSAQLSEGTGAFAALWEELHEFHRLMERHYPTHRIKKESDAALFPFYKNVLTAASRYYRFFIEVPDAALTEETERPMLPPVVLKSILVLGLSDFGEAILELNQLVDTDTPLAEREKFVEKHFTFEAPKTFFADTTGYEITLEAMHTFFLPADFVDIWLQRKENFRKVLPEERYLHWQLNAYYTALSCGHKKSGELAKELQELAPALLESRFDDATYNTVYGLLSPENRILYAAAESQYRSAMESDYGWKDAGMISVGFFRLIEVELRTRILQEVFPENDQLVADFHNDLLNADKSGGTMSRNARSKLLKYAIDHGRSFELKDTIKCLKNPGRTSMENMEYVFGLLSDHASVSSEWNKQYSALKKRLYSVLSEEGIKAAKDNAIAHVIRAETRAAYRNPPAHARYLSIEKAIECRDYVNDVLLTLHTKWLKK